MASPTHDTAQHEVETAVDAEGDEDDEGGKGGGLSLPELFEKLEAHRKRLGVLDYVVSQPTLESSVMIFAAYSMEAGKSVRVRKVST